jgi:hypothetical protein
MGRNTHILATVTSTDTLVEVNIRDPRADTVARFSDLTVPRREQDAKKALVALNGSVS